MTKNPLINGFVASAYIFLIVAAMTYGSQAVPHPSQYFMPVAFISLFTLSAAIMGYLFLYQPILLFIADKKKTAIRLFLKTVGVFAAITVTIFILLFSGLIS